MKKNKLLGTKLLTHVYKNGIRLEVTDKGFTLWNNITGKWIIDGSLLAIDNEVTISNRNLSKKKDNGWIVMDLVFKGAPL